MAHYQNQYSAQSGIDQYGNPIRQTDDVTETGKYVEQLHRTDEFRDTDQYGNPIRRSEEHRGGGIFEHEKPQTQYTAVEQSGHHEKKGIMEKIKEKLPGGHH